MNLRSDNQFIKIALNLAKRGIGQTGPNPPVGCVIVKENRIVGRGFTGLTGRPHAETIALTHAGSACNGATMYVTLEPCAHYGQTPPCVNNIINSKISRIVCPMKDPDPRVSGAGFKKLSEADIIVDHTPIFRCHAEEIMRGFLSRTNKNRPFVTVKLAMSLDGRIASKTGKSQWITNEFLRARAHLLRAQNDAILVGTRTFLSDNPKLNVRGTLHGLLNPLRIFLDYNLTVEPSNSILKNITSNPALIVCGDNPNLNNLKIWKNAGVEILVIPSKEKNVSLRKLLTILSERGINSLLVEGGGKLVKSFLQAGLIDEFVSHRSGIIIGSDGIPSVFEFKKALQEISLYPKMNLRSINSYDDNEESIWKPI